MSEKKYIHVNQGNIRGNLKTKRTGREQELKPVITIKPVSYTHLRAHETS